MHNLPKIKTQVPNSQALVHFINTQKFSKIVNILFFFPADIR